MPFLVLFVVLLVSPRKRLPDQCGRGRARDRRGVDRALAGPGRPRRRVVVVFLLLVPQLRRHPPDRLDRGLATTMLFLSLGPAGAHVRARSRCATSSFAAIGVVAFSHLADDHGCPWFLALLLAGARRDAGRRAAGDPGDPPVRALPRAGDVRLRHRCCSTCSTPQNFMFGDIGLGAHPMPRPGSGSRRATTRLLLPRPGRSRSSCTLSRDRAEPQPARPAAAGHGRQSPTGADDERAPRST